MLTYSVYFLLKKNFPIMLKLDILIEHIFEHLQAIRNRNATWTVHETHKEASMSSLVWFLFT